MPRTCRAILRPREHSIQDHANPVDDRVFVVPGRQARPLLQVRVLALDHVPAPVRVRVEAYGSAAA